MSNSKVHTLINYCTILPLNSPATKVMRRAKHSNTLSISGSWHPFLKVYREADSTISLSYLLSFNKSGFKEVPSSNQQIPPTVLWVHFLLWLQWKRVAEMKTYNMTLCALKTSLPFFPVCCLPAFIHAFSLIIAATIHWHQFCARHHIHTLAPSSIISRIPICKQYFEGITANGEIPLPKMGE